MDTARVCLHVYLGYKDDTVEEKSALEGGSKKVSLGQCLVALTFDDFVRHVDF